MVLHPFAKHPKVHKIQLTKTKSPTTGTKESSDRSNCKPYFSEGALSNPHHCAPVHCFNCLK